MLPAGVIAFGSTVAYQSTKHEYHPCSRFKEQLITSSLRPSVVLTSTKSDSEHESIDGNNYYLLARERSDNASAITSKTTLAKFFNVFKRRRRRGLPRTTVTDLSNIQQHAVNLLYRLGRESCFVATLLLLLYRLVLTTTTTSSFHNSSLRKFITINLTRWVAASLSVKLLSLHSQITAVVDQSSSLGHTANIMDEDWFLKGDFHVNFQNDPALDDYLYNTETTSVYNTRANATSSHDSALVRIRQVPSDGSCLFHAIGARLLHDQWLYRQSTEKQHKKHPPMSSITEYSTKLRQQAVDALQDNPQRQFKINQDENEVPITASTLVQLASDPYGISSEEYLTSMRDESVWGGGPEIIALASELKRQIVVLEPDESVGADISDVCFLKVRARFGDTVFDDGSNTVYILNANQQFPERHGRGRDDCNHFLAVFAYRSV